VDYIGIEIRWLDTMTKDEFKLDWASTFEDLKYKSKKRGGNDTEFGTCLKCLRKTYKNFDEKEMRMEGKKQGVIVHFVDCDEHAGATV